MKCQDCSAPATALYLNAYGPGQHMPVCGPDGLYYGLQGHFVRPLPLTRQDYYRAFARAFSYVRKLSARRAAGLPDYPKDPPF